MLEKKYIINTQFRIVLKLHHATTINHNILMHQIYLLPADKHNGIELWT